MSSEKAKTGMDAVPREILHEAYRRKPIYLLKIPFAFAMWGLAVWAIWLTQSTPYAIPVGVLASLFIATQIRGLGAIGHDAVHGNLARSKVLSYLISLVCWAPTGMSVTIYGNYHLHHHKITNQYADVDNFVVTDYTKSRSLGRVLLLCVYTFAYPIYFLFCMTRYYVKRLSFAKLVRMHLEVAAFWGLVFWLQFTQPMQVMFFAWWLPFIFGSMFASITSMIEHYEMPLTGDDAYSSRTYGTKSHVVNFFWNNVTFHNEHHKYPGIPFYNLRSFHEQAFPYYDDQVKAEVYPTTVGPALMLFKRILAFDPEVLEKRYAGLDRRGEKDKLMKLPGIQPGAA
ncbi:MAG: fatty acid desaturase [Polyangiaceae bacterium]